MKSLIFAVSLAFAPPTFAEDIKFVTEEYAPFNYSQDGQITGIAVEQVRIIAKEVGLTYTIDIMPWARALALAESQPRHCVFTTGHNKERDPKFRWVEPLLKDQMVMVRRRGSAIAATSFDEARKLRIGSQRDDFAVEALKQHGFTKIDLAANIDVTLGKLLSDRIDLMPTSVKTYRKMVADGHPVEQAMLMDGQIYGIACHKDVSPETIAKLQAALDALITSGRQDEIFTRYGLAPNARTAAAD